MRETVADMSDLDDLIRLYFRLSFSNKEILSILAHSHQTIISVRTLKRICKRLGLFRRKNQSNLEEVLAFVQQEIMINGQMQVYRWLHLRAIQHGFVVSQDTVRCIIKLVDPQGVELRQAWRLRRRQYSCRGPNGSLYITWKSWILWYYQSVMKHMSILLKGHTLNCIYKCYIFDWIISGVNLPTSKLQYKFLCFVARHVHSI